MLSSYIYRPPPVPIRQLDEKEFQFVRNLDGVPCLWLPAPEVGGHPEECLLFFHGNASRIEDLLDDMRIIQNRLPVTIVAVEYPGFGLAAAAGPPTTHKIRGSVAWVYDMLADDSYFGKNRITVAAHSIGTGPAAYIAATRQPKRVVLVSPFTTVAAVAERVLKHSVFASSASSAATASYEWDNLAAIQHYRCSLIIYHGTDDDLIPVSMGRQVYAAAVHTSEKAMVELPGMKHIVDFKVVADDLLERLKPDSDKNRDIAQEHDYFAAKPLPPVFRRGIDDRSENLIGHTPAAASSGCVLL